jgi:uncharacterized membrane protein
MAKTGILVRHGAVVTWGLSSEVGLCGILHIWLTFPEDTDFSPLGQYGSAALLASAILASVVGIVVALTFRRPSRLLRWSVGLLVAVAAGLVTALTIAAMVADRHGVWMLLGYGAAGTYVVAWDVSRPARP